jgi:hypothetical protein
VPISNKLKLKLWYGLFNSRGKAASQLDGRRLEPANLIVAIGLIGIY